MEIISKEYKPFHPKTRNQWRKWLEKNHQSSPGIWFIYYKKESGKPRVSYDEAVEEALCFSWIDSAKRPETRGARIKQTVLMADANKKHGIKGFKL